MPLKLNAGLTKKIGLPEYGSLGASCHVELELDAHLLQQDAEQFLRHVQQAFAACRQAVEDELARHRPNSSQHLPPTNANGANGQHASGNGTRPTPGQTSRGAPRPATASQVRALHAIASRLGLDLTAEINARFGRYQANDLSIGEASQLIDALKALGEAGAPS